MENIRLSSIPTPTSSKNEVPVGTVKSRLHYGRQALRKSLEGLMDGESLPSFEYKGS